MSIIKKFFKLIFGIILALGNCQEKNVDNPQEAFEYWYGNYPKDSITVVNGLYWKSAHFTYEYTVYFELDVEKNWIKNFILQNKMNDTSRYWGEGENFPEWFLKAKELNAWNNENLWIFADTSTGKVFIYDYMY